MFCRDCGEKLSNKEAIYCVSCGKLQKKDTASHSLIHWIPVILVIIGLIMFTFLGGNHAAYEVNAWDIIAGIMGVVAFIISLIAIPKESRIALYIISVILSSILTLFAFAWVLTYGG